MEPVLDIRYQVVAYDEGSYCGIRSQTRCAVSSKRVEAGYDDSHFRPHPALTQNGQERMMAQFKMKLRQIGRATVNHGALFEVEFALGCLTNFYASNRAEALAICANRFGIDR